LQRSSGAKQAVVTATVCVSSQLHRTERLQRHADDDLHRTLTSFQLWLRTTW